MKKIVKFNSLLKKKKPKIKNYNNKMMKIYK